MQSDRVPLSELLTNANSYGRCSWRLVRSSTEAIQLTFLRGRRKKANREAPVVVETTSVTGLAVRTSGANIPKIQVMLPDGKLVWTRPAYVTARKVI